MPTITRLAQAGRTRVRIELDGEPWRSLPSAIVEDLSLTTGSELTRPVLRTLRRRLRQHEAASHARRILSASDTSSANLEAALGRRGVAPAERESLLDSLSASGLLSDARASGARAAKLAERGYGNLAIEFKLEAEGYGEADRRNAIDTLDAERARAEAFLARKKRAPAEAARLLAQRGFEADVCEAVSGVYDAYG